MFHHDNLHFQKTGKNLCPHSSSADCNFLCVRQSVFLREHETSQTLLQKNRQKKKIKIRHKLSSAESPETSGAGDSIAVISRVSSRKNSTPLLSRVKLYYISQLWKLC